MFLQCLLRGSVWINVMVCFLNAGVHCRFRVWHSHLCGHFWIYFACGECEWLNALQFLLFSCAWINPFFCQQTQTVSETIVNSKPNNLSYPTLPGIKMLSTGGIDRHVCGGSWGSVSLAFGLRWLFLSSEEVNMVLFCFRWKLNTFLIHFLTSSVCNPSTSPHSPAKTLPPSVIWIWCNCPFECSLCSVWVELHICF